jgi:hypothetical protein
MEEMKESHCNKGSVGGLPIHKTQSQLIMRNNSSVGTNNEEANEIRSYDSRQKAS